MSPGREPGREMDAAIAEKVMGLKLVGDWYSTDNAAAISALEHHGQQYEIYRYSANEYRVRVWCAAQATGLYVTGDLAPTLAHAACLALLRAVGAA